MSRYPKFSVFFVLTSIMVAASVGCHGDDGSEAQPHRVRYTFEWQSHGAVVEADRITFQTDLGYEVVMTHAYAVAYTVLLVPCEDDDEPLDVPGMGRWLWEQLTPRTAWAGHSYGNDNDSAVGVPYTEDILSSENMVLEREQVMPADYCQFFYLVGRADGVTEKLPTEPNLDGLSLYVAGTYRLPEEAPQSFVLQTTRAYALKSELYAPGEYGEETKAFRVNPGDGDIEVRVTRHLDGLFDGVDFRTMSLDAQVTRVLTQLIDQAEMSVVVAP